MGMSLSCVSSVALDQIKWIPASPPVLGTVELRVELGVCLTTAARHREDWLSALLTFWVV